MKKINQGLFLVLITTVISGFSVFLNTYAVKLINQSSVHTTAKNLIATLVLSLLFLTPLAIKKLKGIARVDWLKLVLIGLIGGSIPFLLFFKAVSLTSATNTAFIHKTLFIWVSLLAVWFLREKIGRLQYGALVLLFLGNFALLGFKFISFDYGVVLALIATLFWAVEFVIAKKILSRIDSLVVGWARMFFGSIFLIGYVASIGKFNMLFNLSVIQWQWELLLGILLAIYVFTWYGALKRLPAVTVTSILVLASPLTTFLNNIFGPQSFSHGQLIGCGLIISAIILFIYSVRQTKNVVLANSSTI